MNLGSAFLTSNDQYLVIIVSCVGERIKDKQEPFLAELSKHFPQVMIYGKRADGSKDKPGTIKIVGKADTEMLSTNSLSNRQFILCFAQYYAGKNDFPSDSRQQRLVWFKNCMDAIAKIPNLKSLGFPINIAGNNGGNWDDYKQIITDLDNSLKLEHPEIKINLHHEPMLDDQRQKTYQRIVENNGEFWKRVGDDAPVIIGLRKEQHTMFNSNNMVILQTMEPTIIVPKSDLIESNPRTVLPMPKKRIKESLIDAVEIPKSISKTGLEAHSYLVPIVSGRPEPEMRSFDANPNWIPIGFLPIDQSWSLFFQDSILRQEILIIEQELQSEIAQFGDYFAILPSQGIFKAFHTPKSRVKVVILGMDPYHSEIDQAMGLAFSVPDSVAIPPSLRNILKELKSDVNVDRSSGSLQDWADQGVLLLNTALTVRQKKPGGHLVLWQKFTDRVIELLASDVSKPKVFLLWGLDAQKKTPLIKEHNKILTANHPSPLSANRGGWFGTQHFSKCNQILRDWKLSEIIW